MDGLDLKLEFESYETINFINMILIFSYRLKVSFWIKYVKSHLFLVTFVI